MQITRHLSALLIALIIALSLHASGVEARYRRHHKRGITSDYEYRDNQDYSSGIFIDSVPITTEHPKHTRPHQKTNRFPKLRKFFAERERYFH